MSFFNINKWNKSGPIYPFDLPNLKNSKQYVERARQLLVEPNALSKVRPNGEMLRYSAETNIFGAYTPDGVPKTMFRPRDNVLYWDRLKL